MSLTRRQKDEVLARAKFQGYETRFHSAYGDTELSVVIIGEHGNSSNEAEFEDKVVNLLRPSIIIHYLQDVPQKRSTRFNWAKRLSGIWTDVYGLIIAPVDETPEDEQSMPRWCDNKEYRRWLMNQGDEQECNVLRTIERFYGLNEELIVVITEPSHVQSRSLLSRVLRDEDAKGKPGDGITHLLIDLASWK